MLARLRLDLCQDCMPRHDMRHALLRAAYLGSIIGFGICAASSFIATEPQRLPDAHVDDAAMYYITKYMSKVDL